eukprot:5847280-Prymnesium_polylepis.1
MLAALVVGMREKDCTSSMYAKTDSTPDGRKYEGFTSLTCATSTRWVGSCRTSRCPPCISTPPATSPATTSATRQSPTSRSVENRVLRLALGEDGRHCATASPKSLGTKRVETRRGRRGQQCAPLAS